MIFKRFTRTRDTDVLKPEAIRSVLMNALEAHIEATPLHPQGIATIRTPQYVATLDAATGLVEVHDVISCVAVYRSGSQSAYCPDVYIPGMWPVAIVAAHAFAA